MKAYRTHLATSKDGSATYGIAEVWHSSGARTPYYHVIGNTRFFRTASRATRARSGAATICKRHCRLVHGNARDIQISEQ